MELLKIIHFQVWNDKKGAAAPFFLVTRDFAVIRFGELITICSFGVFPTVT